MITVATIRLHTPDVPPPGGFRVVDDRAESRVPKPGRHQQQDGGAAIVFEDGAVINVPQQPWMTNGQRVKTFYSNDGELHVERIEGL